MIEPVKAETVIVNREKNGGPQGPEVGEVTHAVHKDVIPEDGKPPVKGTLMGIMYRSASGWLCASIGSYRAPEGGEIAAITEREEQAKAEYEAAREGLWNGGGRVTYTTV